MLVYTIPKSQANENLKMNFIIANCLVTMLPEETQDNGVTINILKSRLFFSNGDLKNVSNFFFYDYDDTQ